MNPFQAMDPPIGEGPRRDISSRIKVGEPHHLGGLSWRIPYDADDEEGNRAQTVFRKVSGWSPDFFLLMNTSEKLFVRVHFDFFVHLNIGVRSR